MKKIFALLICVTVLLCALCGCRETPIEIEDYEWKMMTAQIENEGTVTACRGELLNIYQYAQVIYLKLDAQNGVITLIDHTGDEEITYTGSYILDESVYNAGSKGASQSTYTVTFGDKVGSAVIFERNRLFFSDYVSMMLTIDGYAINFEPMEN